VENDDYPAVARPRTTTGQLRVVNLMTAMISDAAWKRPTLTLDKSVSPAREIVAVVSSGQEAGVPVAYWENDRLFVMALHDEGYDIFKGDWVHDSRTGECYVELGEADCRWAERILLAQRVQRKLEERAALDAIPVLL
jgi:hypothetical protein